MDNDTKPTETGMNRTGIKASPIDAKAMLAGAAVDSTAPADGQALETERLDYARQAAPLGTMPPPATLKGAAKVVLDTVQGKETNVFLDLIGERLAFERAGTRLYDALLVKWEAASQAHQEGPSREELERIRDEEQLHFVLCKEAIEQLGGDPTAVTPSADVVGVAGMGWTQVVTDPRTTLTEGLKILLQAELVDNDCWLTLADLAARLGQDELAERFRRALADEEEHLARVRSWVLTAVEGQAGLDREDVGERPEPLPAP